MERRIQLTLLFVCGVAIILFMLFSACVPEGYDLPSEPATTATTTTVGGTIPTIAPHGTTTTVLPDCPRYGCFYVLVIPTDFSKCPEYRRYDYVVVTDLPVVEMILPPGCTATSPTTGACVFPIEDEPYQVTISGRGYSWDKIQCGSDFMTTVVDTFPWCREEN